MKKTTPAGRDDRPSKTRRKKDSLSLQALGEALIDLKPEELESLALPGRLREALAQAQRIKKHGALRRQRQFIGRLMRDIDPEPIREFLDRRQSLREGDTRLFHEAESWRHRLLEGDAETRRQCAATLGIDERGLADRITAISDAPSEPLRKSAARALFGYLHDALVTGAAGRDR